MLDKDSMLWEHGWILSDHRYVDKVSIGGIEMGLLGNIFSSSSVNFNEEIRSAYKIKGYVKTNIDWEKAFSFAKEKNSLIYDGDEDVDFYMHQGSEEIRVRFLRNPKTGKTVIIVSNADVHRQMIREMESGEFDFDKYPSYKLEF